MKDFSTYSVYELASFLSSKEFKVWETPSPVQTKMQSIANEIFFLLEFKNQQDWYRKIEIQKSNGKIRELLSPTGIGVMKERKELQKKQRAKQFILIPHQDGIDIEEKHGVILDRNGNPIDKETCPEVYSPLHYFQSEVSRILEHYLQIPNNCCAFRKNYNHYKSIRSMLNKLHAQGNGNISSMFKTDISNYFPSISSEMIVEALLQHNNYNLKSLGREKLLNAEAAELLAYLCTNNGKLTQGSPSSPVLANLVGYERMDKHFLRLLNRHQIDFIRYADDIIVLSTNEITQEEIEAMKDIISEAGFKISDEKTRYETQKDNQTHYQGLGVSIKSTSINNSHFGFKIGKTVDIKHYEEGLSVINNGYQEDTPGKFSGYVQYNNIVGHYGKVVTEDFRTGLKLSRRLQHLLSKHPELLDYVIKTKNDTYT